MSEPKRTPWVAAYHADAPEPFDCIHVEGKPLEWAGPTVALIVRAVNSHQEATQLAERILKLEDELRVPGSEDELGLVEVEEKDWNALVRLAREVLGRNP